MSNILAPFKLSSEDLEYEQLRFEIEMLVSENSILDVLTKKFDDMVPAEPTGSNVFRQPVPSLADQVQNNCQPCLVIPNAHCEQSRSCPATRKDAPLKCKRFSLAS
jgi:hypothetical protein